MYTTYLKNNNTRLHKTRKDIASKWDNPELNRGRPRGKPSDQDWPMK